MQQSCISDVTKRIRYDISKTIAMMRSFKINQENRFRPKNTKAEHHKGAVTLSLSLINDSGIYSTKIISSDLPPSFFIC